MTDVSFYHLQHSRLDEALPQLLEKTLAAGQRALVLSDTPDRIDHLDGVLWTYKPESWLPHGRDGDDHAADTPVWLSTADTNPNAATYLFLTAGAESAHVGDYERCFELFDGNDDAAVADARDRWKAYKAAGHDVTYLQQVDRRWVKKG